MKAESTKGKVLITGINGFLGSHIARLLLENGYTVRGTVRDKNNKEKLAALTILPFSHNMEIYEADLLNTPSLEKAVEGCDYVMHVAAPVLMSGDDSVIIDPAVKGTKAILEAAIKYKVKAAVMTSSLAAVINSDVAATKVLDEEDWPNMEKPQSPYIRAKTLAEKAAWDIYNKTPKESRPRLTMIDPGYILGPTLTKTPFHSGNIVRDLMNGKMKELPKLLYAIVDVRDVALAHMKALENPSSDGKRYVCFSGEYFWIEDLAKVLKEEFERYGYKIEAKAQEECPDKDKTSFLNARWGMSFKLSNDKIRKDLGIEFIKAKQAAIDMGYSMIAQGLVEDKIKKFAAF